MIQLLSHPARSIRSRLILQIGLMIVGLLLLGAASIWGINGLHHDYGGALDGYQQLRTAYEIGFQIATARSALSGEAVDSVRASTAIESALSKIAAADDASRGQMLELHGELLEVQKAIRAAQRPARIEASILDRSLSLVAKLSAQIRQSITASQLAADARRRFTLIVVCSTCILVLVGGIIIGIRQYRGVIRPIARLSQAVRRISAGNFADRIPTAGDDQEFIALAQDFNRMAAELESLYRDLDAKVAVKSKQLVRSERLASVGFLAAGVAHEINNPLSIITGFGERALQQMDQLKQDATLPDRTRKALTVICEEAFRCKSITDRLLTLARPADEQRCITSLATLADEVISNIGSLAQYNDRRITLESESPDEALIHASVGQIKQVVLNLVLNALEAVPAGSGEVKLTLARKAGQVELIVTDNGRGMTPATLEHVFEPFFTEKRGTGDTGSLRGTGLGLSITHAIVIDHGGSIHAESDGPLQGSRFIVRFPAAQLAQRDA